MFQKMNHSYYLNRIFSELFDIEIRLMELENGQFDYKDDVFRFGPKNILEEIPTKPEFDADLFVFWLLMLWV